MCIDNRRLGTAHDIAKPGKLLSMCAAAFGSFALSSAGSQFNCSQDQSRQCQYIKLYTKKMLFWQFFFGRKGLQHLLLLCYYSRQQDPAKVPLTRAKICNILHDHIIMRQTRMFASAMSACHHKDICCICRECMDLLKELDAPVKHIILTTHAYEHKIFISPFQRRFPDAQVYVPPK